MQRDVHVELTRSSTEHSIVRIVVDHLEYVMEYSMEYLMELIIWWSRSSVLCNRGESLPVVEERAYVLRRESTWCNVLRDTVEHSSLLVDYGVTDGRS